MRPSVWLNRTDRIWCSKQPGSGGEGGGDYIFDDAARLEMQAEAMVAVDPESGHRFTIRLDGILFDDFKQRVYVLAMSQELVPAPSPPPGGGRGPTEATGGRVVLTAEAQRR